MKTFARIGSLVLALGAAAVLAGCSSYRNNVTQRARPASDFEVVETSAKRMLTTKEMAELKAAVGKFLEQEGAVSRGNYYVKVYLTPEQEGMTADWVIVRFSRDSDMRFELLGSDDTYVPGNRTYAAYDYYPYGYDNFSRLSFQYYGDPYYYGSGYYVPPVRRNTHDRDHDRDGDRDHKGGKDRDHDRDGNRDSGNPHAQDNPHNNPLAPAGSPPQVTRTRWDGNSSGQNNPPRENPGQRHGGVQPASSPSNQSAAQPEQRRDASGGYTNRSEAYRNQPSRPERTESPRSEPRVQSSNYTPPAPRNESVRGEPSFRTSSQEAPSYSPPAARTESRAESRSNANENRQQTKGADQRE